VSDRSARRDSDSPSSGSELIATRLAFEATPGSIRRAAAPRRVGTVAQEIGTDLVRLRFVVTEDDTSIALGSGDVRVLATPRLIAWLEAATLVGAKSRLRSGETTVGTRVVVDHVLATRIGVEVFVFSRLSEVRGRRICCEVWAEQTSAAGTERIASGEIVRVIVDAESFMAGTRP
jgi:fluoroacetyl-CoA thioesterase